MDPAVDDYLNAVDASYDSSSPNGSGTGGSGNSGDSFLSTLSGLATTGANVYRSVQGNPGNHPLDRNTAARSTASLTKYLPWAIGALIAVVVLGLVFRRK